VISPRIAKYDYSIEADLNAVLLLKNRKLIIDRITGIASDFEGYLARGDLSIISKKGMIYDHCIDGLEIEGFSISEGYRIIFSVTDDVILLLRIHYVENIKQISF
jgi:hypothetical protein